MADGETRRLVEGANTLVAVATAAGETESWTDMLGVKIDVDDAMTAGDTFCTRLADGAWTDVAVAITDGETLRRVAGA